MAQNTATLLGFLAILFWAILTLLAVLAAPVPPFQLIAMCFTVGGILGLIWTLKTGSLKALKSVPLRIYAFGSLCIFGFHFLFFTALRLAPPAEASLINYLWPLLIVLFSGLLPGEKLRSFHIIGALIAFVGAALLVAGGAQLSGTAWLGYLCACGSALMWSGYSVLSRRLGNTPTSAVTLYCFAAAGLAALCHLGFENTAWPATHWGWIAIVALGIGPTGGAFFVWDIGMKHGDIQLLGTAAYAAPLLSTILLVVAGRAEPTPVLALASILITLGALMAAYAKRLSQFMPSKDA